MENKLVKQVESARTLSRKTKLLLVTILAAAIATGALAVFLPSAPQEAQTAAANAATTSARLLTLDQSLFAVVGTADSTSARNDRLRAINENLYPDESISARKVAETNARLLELNNRLYPPDAIAAANLRQQDLKDAWLERGNVGPASGSSSSSISTAERQQDLKDAWLERGTVDSSSGISTAQRQQDLKDAWLERGTVDSSSGISTAQRQQDLKDAWLERGNFGSSSGVSAAQRHEELKDAWLAHRN